MKINVHGERAAERCAFCHGDLALARVECTRCRAAYHDDCTSRCILVGCTEGCLVPVRAFEPSPVPDEGSLVVASMIVTTCALPMTFGLVIGLPGRLTFSALALNVFAWIVTMVVASIRSGRGERRAAFAKRPRPVRVSAALRPPAPPEGAVRFPDLFNVTPIEVAGDRSVPLEERQHQREALGDRRPPGLGRTI